MSATMPLPPETEFDNQEKIGYLMRAVEDLSAFVKAHMADEEARFAKVETKITALNEKLDKMEKRLTLAAVVLVALITAGQGPSIVALLLKLL